MKRIIYDLDEKVFNLIKKTIASLVIEEGGISIYNEKGKIFIHKNTLFNEAIPLLIYLDSADNNSMYTFSKEFSEKAREVIFEIYDTLDTNWKNGATKVADYLKQEEELFLKREAKEFLDYLESEIFRVENSESNEADKNPVIYTTKKDDFVFPLKSNVGFGVNDLKPKVFNAYVSLLAKYKEKFVVNLKSLHNLEVEFIYNV